MSQRVSLRGWYTPVWHAPWSHRLLAGAAIILSIALTAWVTSLTTGHTPLIVASMGAAALLMFGLPSSPLSQPWPLIAGHLVSSAVGVACARWIPDPFLASGCAVAGALLAMSWLRCLHPPGGAIALTAVIGGPQVHALGFSFVVLPVGVNACILVVIGVLLHRMLPGKVYPLPLGPARPHRVDNPLPQARSGIGDEDIARAIGDIGHVLDISDSDLDAIVTTAARYARERRGATLTVASTMARNVVTLRPDNTRQQAWDALKTHKVSALPVVDADRHVVGMVSVADFLVRIDTSLASVARRLLTRHTESVASMMTTAVVSARSEQNILDLVPVFSDRGMHSLPVLDTENRLVGMLSQSDMVAALAARETG